MKDIVTLNGLMVYYLQTLYLTEWKWSSAITQIYDQVNSPELKELLFRSEGISQNHLRIIDEILKELNENPSFETARVAEGLIEEMHAVLKKTVDPEVRDAAIVVFHQCINHYKIAQYGTISAFALALGEEKIAASIHHLLEEEKGSDDALSKLAESKINPQAKSPLLK